jgi:hypothetical protein
MRHLLFLVALLASPHAASAQITAAECSAQVSAIQTRAADMRGWERIAECGSSGGQAIASAIRAARTSTDSIYLKNLITAASRIRESNVFQAALDIADDPGATVPARVTALVVLLAQYSNAFTLFPRHSWQSLVSVPLSPGCGISTFSANSYLSDVGLPAHAYDQIASHAEALAANASAPPVVRTLARCVRLSVLAAVPDTVDLALISFDYVCATKYRVHNGGTKWIDVTYQLYHVAEHSDLSVAPGGDVTFFTDAGYGVALYYRGQLIRDAQNGQTQCPP